MSLDDEEDPRMVLEPIEVLRVHDDAQTMHVKREMPDKWTAELSGPQGALRAALVASVDPSGAGVCELRHDWPPHPWPIVCPIRLPADVPPSLRVAFDG